MSGERLLLDSYLKTLKLPTMRAEYEALTRQCSQTDAPTRTSSSAWRNRRCNAARPWPSNDG